MLPTLVALLVAAVLFVPLTRRLGFGSVLGYLLGGVAIGPAGLRLVTDVEQIAHVSELGVIMLLFLIGLELRPARLWVMRKSVFGLGGGQVLASAAAIAVLARLAGFGWTAGVVLGAGLAMSSTAIVLPMLGERDLLQTRAGRDGFAVLLFQDMAFIPLVALVPLLGGGRMPALPIVSVAIGLAAIAAILVGGRFLLGPAFRAIGGARTPELFTLMALLAVAGTAFLASSAGLSASLGAFMAGVLLSESEFRHELQADIEPFEGLLLGFFFISVGMSAELGLVLREPATILLGLAGLLAAKIAIAWLLARLWRLDAPNALRFALALCQGSEFSFVLFAAATAAGALGEAQADLATLVIALSMVATPLLFAASERFLVTRLTSRAAPVYDAIESDGEPVIVCGFGRVGQIVGRILRMQGIGFTALEGDAEQLAVVRRFGMKAFYGDPKRPDLLRAAGAETAKVLVIALDDMEEALRVADIARRTFPHLAIISRARNRRHVHLLLDRGITSSVRETFHSSLKLSELVLGALHVPQDQVARAVQLFAEHDERTLRAAHAYYRDEAQLIQSGRQAAEELTTLFESDQARPRGAPVTPP
jgi:CPA2 family monovalent cation:H+ antiporter-2/glutathione-regulated potassium-efflux system protein KefB